MKKRIVLLLLALLIALGSMGAGYSLWAEWLYIDGTVSTGTLDAEMTLEGCGSDDAKAASSISASTDGTTLTVTIDNAYPSITYWVDFDIDNVGTIPFHIVQYPMGGTLPASTNITIDNLTSKQVHPGFAEYGTLTIHLKNDAEQGATYTFSVDFQCHQYNEAPAPHP